MRSMGLKYYRMSISWARLFPNGEQRCRGRACGFACALFGPRQLGRLAGSWCFMLVLCMLVLLACMLVQLPEGLVPSPASTAAGKGKVNERGVAFYDRLINELVANKIMPVVTL